MSRAGGWSGEASQGDGTGRSGAEHVRAGGRARPGGRPSMTRGADRWTHPRDTRPADGIYQVMLSPTIMTEEHTRSDLGLASSGDMRALARLVDAYHEDMIRVSYVVCGDAELARDAVQSAWVVACRKLHTVRDAGRLRGWLMAVAVNEARQVIRQRRRTAIVDLTVAGDLPATDADPAGRSELVDLARVIRDLSADDRAFLGLRYAAGMDATEIGQALGMSASGVRSRLARLLARLRTELDHER